MRRLPTWGGRAPEWLASWPQDPAEPHVIGKGAERGSNQTATGTIIPADSNKKTPESKNDPRLRRRFRTYQDSPIDSGSPPTVRCLLDEVIALLAAPISPVRLQPSRLEEL